MSAKSSRKPRPPTSTPCRFRRAEAAVSGSLYSQKPKPLGLPVAWSKTRLGRASMWEREEMGEGAPEGDDGADGAKSLRGEEVRRCKRSRRRGGVPR